MEGFTDLINFKYSWILLLEYLFICPWWSFHAWCGLFLLFSDWVVSDSFVTTCSPPASSAHVIFQVRILEWVGISSSRGSSWPRDWTPLLPHLLHCRWILCCWATREAQSVVRAPKRNRNWNFVVLIEKAVSVQFSHSVVPNSLQPHGLQLARPPCPSPTPGTCSNSCPSSRWCHSTISSTIVPFSTHLQSFPESGSFPMSRFFATGVQSIGVSASTSVLPMKIQDWFPLG